MKHFYVLLLVSSFIAYAEHADTSDSRFEAFASAANTVNGVPVTAESILAMVPPMKPEEQEFIQAWLRMRPDVAAIMSGVEAFTGEKPVVTQDNNGRAAYYKNTQGRLEAAGLTNLSKSSNTVVAVDDFIIKASSLANRHKGIGRGIFGMEYGAQISPEQLEEFIAEPHNGATYQTISRVAYIERAKEARRLFGLDRIEFPEKHLVHIPGRPENVEDANYIVVERKIKNIVADLQNHPLALDPEIMRQLTLLVGYTALWNHVGSGGNIFVVKNPETQQLNINYHDTEQPNVHSPADFFHKDPSVHFSNVAHGWNGIKDEIIKPFADKLKNNLDTTDLPKEQKEFLKSLIDERVVKLLQEKEKLEQEISSNFPKV